MHQYNFEKLEIWNLAMDFACDIYDLSEKYPKTELYGLRSQITRSASSISANIAEGVCRVSGKEKARFIEIAYGSAIETLNHSIFSQRRKYFSLEDLNNIRLKVNELTNKINAFYKSVLNKKKNIKLSSKNYDKKTEN